MPASRRVSTAQLEELVAWMEAHPLQARATQLSTPQAKQSSHRLWDELASRLNAVGEGSTKTAKEWRQLEERNSQRVKDQAEGANGIGRCSFRVRGASSLQAGDVFVTRHSNLAEAHVAFHLVVDDSLRSGDITSRHPAILGLRNILKAACANDVTSVSFPLLLRHEHSEEMTAAWCLRRAELVLKCAKGFLVEAAGWGGAPLRTLHAALPPDTQPALFAQLANLLPTIFRLSNPVKVKHAHLT